MHAINSEATAPAVHLSGLSLSVGGERVLHDAAIDLKAGQWTCLLGQSGSGKTTLLKFLCGLIQTVHSDYTLSTSNDQPLQSQLVWMAQQDLLLPWMTAIDNVLLGARLRGESNNNKASTKDKAHALLNRVGLSDSAAKFPHELSGGMRQRVALARTLMQEKSVCLLDEPFASVDAITRHKLQALAHELLDNHTVLLVTHDPLEALRCGHRLHVLSHRAHKVLPAIDVPGEPLRAVDSAPILTLRSRLLNELAHG